MKAIRLYCLLSAGVILAACAVTKKSGKEVRIDGSIYIENPVCQPGKDPEAGAPVPLGNASYYIKPGDMNDPAVIANKLLKTDENGKFFLKLRPGTYSIVHADKLMSFAEFRLKYGSTSTYYKDREDDCFRRWHDSPDFLLKVASGTVVMFTVKSKCYTYTNPCVEYSGTR